MSWVPWRFLFAKYFLITLTWKCDFSILTEINQRSNKHPLSACKYNTFSHKIVSGKMFSSMLEMHGLMESESFGKQYSSGFDY